MTLSYFSVQTVVLEDTSPPSGPVAVQVSRPPEALPEAHSGAGAVQRPCSLLIHSTLLFELHCLNFCIYFACVQSFYLTQRIGKRSYISLSTSQSGWHRHCGQGQVWPLSPWRLVLGGDAWAPEHLGSSTAAPSSVLKPGVCGEFWPSVSLHPVA